jgi:thymidylate synthase ThyX
MTISAKIIADSISDAGIRITTYELEYPRFIHAEFMTHRVFSRNAASSRAIPVAKAIELIIADTAMPIHWGKNQPGMSAKEECNELVKHGFISHVERAVGHLWALATKKEAWNVARDCAIKMAEAFSAAGYHKQIVNRLLEPFSHIKVVLTATEYDNFFWLRKHPDAQPEIQRLAEVMWEEREKSTPYLLKAGEWHVPYYDKGFWSPASGYVMMTQFEMEETDDKYGHTLADAIAISSSCCAQVSYRRLDDSLEKARDIYKRLVESKPVHASPFEHQATPIVCKDKDIKNYYQDDGFTHRDVHGYPWSGNFRGWIQNRQLIPNNVCEHYVP